MDTVTYELRLREGGGVVYIGTTNDPDRREQEHRDSGKKFNHMHITSVKMTEEDAMKKEKEMLSTYRQNHEGNNPKYNKDDDG